MRADIFALAFETELLTEDALLRDLVVLLANTECLDLELKGPSKFIFSTECSHFLESQDKVFRLEFFIAEIIKKVLDFFFFG